MSEYTLQQRTSWTTRRDEKAAAHARRTGLDARSNPASREDGRGPRVSDHEWRSHSNGGSL
jgi:hypothetical protein